ncbi:MAG: 6-bladed beta-propeller [Candidatus Nitrosocaldaceae archaeon]
MSILLILILSDNNINAIYYIAENELYNFEQKFGRIDYPITFNYLPGDVAVDSKDRIIVADIDMIHIFNSNGDYITSFNGYEYYGSYSPKGGGNITTGFIASGVAVDSKDRIIVADISDNNYNNSYKIDIYNKNGEFIRSLDFTKWINGTFYPREVAVDSKDRIIVADIIWIIISDNNGNFIRAFKPAIYDEEEIIKGMAIDKNDNIIVATIDRIYVYDSNSTLIREFLYKGSNSLTKISVEVDSKDRIIVADIDNYKIDIYNKVGNLIRTFSYNEIVPRGIAVLNDNIIVLSTDSLYVFNNEGNLLTKLESNVFREPKFAHPHGVAVDSKDRIIVADTGNNRIQIFDSKGNFVRRFMTAEYGEVIDVAVDSKDRIIVADTGNNRIQIFDSKGNFIDEFGTYGNDNGEFAHPHGVAVDSKDRIIVADTGNNRIQIFFPHVILKLFGSSKDSDNIIYINENITASIISNDNSIEYVRFKWINPNGEIARDMLVRYLDMASDTFIPNMKGEWKVIVEFNDNRIEHSINVGFTVIPEFSIPLIILSIALAIVITKFDNLSNIKKIYQ